MLKSIKLQVRVAAIFTGAKFYNQTQYWSSFVAGHIFSYGI